VEDSEKIIGLASSMSIIVAKELDIRELAILSEFLGLLRHNLDVIRHRRVIPKIVKDLKEIKDKC